MRLDFDQNRPRMKRMSRSRLPEELSTFVGREKDLAALEAAVSPLSDQARLVTLTGAGGVGKSRLATRVASRLHDAYAGAVVWVELAPLSSTDLIGSTVLAALGRREVPGVTAAETLVDAIGQETVLLLLDNCEHILDGCAKLAEALLRSCSQLHVFATSREALRIPGELVYRVPSLSVPETHQAVSPEMLHGYEAVRLFVNRARLLDPSFEFDTSNAKAVAELCIRLDGIPLAIELAAARVQSMTVADIVDRLSDRFRLLTIGSRTAMPRHQTLRATVDWSYGLLTAIERVLFRRLAVFAGGWPLEAAEAVCSDELLCGDDVFHALTQLIFKSLVGTETRDGRLRYSFLETIRQYAEQKLQESGELAQIRSRHRDWYMDFAEHGYAAAMGHDQRVWLDAFEGEHDNLRVALGWSLADPDGGEAGVRMTGALARFWHWRGHISEGRDRIGRALAREGGTPAMRARAFTLAALLEWRFGDTATASARAEQGVVFAGRSDDASLLASALRYRAYLSAAQGQSDQARKFAAECLTVARSGKDGRELAWALAFDGFLAYRDDNLARARSRLEEALSCGETIGDQITINTVLVTLGAVSLAENNHVLAGQQFDHALTVARRLDFKLGTADALTGLGDCARARNN
jgi:predicted ATPase